MNDSAYNDLYMFINIALDYRAFGAVGWCDGAG